jgi:Spy/CpxP family protein refolding chaperone
MTFTIKHVRSLAALTLAAAAATAVAQEATPAPEIDNFVSTKSRTQVIAELLEAQRAGRIARNDFEEQRLAFADFKSTKTRAQVIAETREAIRLGLVARNEFDYNNPRLPTQGELELIRLAGERALSSPVAQRR